MHTRMRPCTREPIPHSIRAPIHSHRARSLNLGESKQFGFGFRDYMRRVMGPYLFLRFLALPAPLLIFGTSFYRNAVINMCLADVLSNIHSFIIIATNHCGDDMYTFEESVVPKSGR